MTNNTVSLKNKDKDYKSMWDDCFLSLPKETQSELNLVVAHVTKVIGDEHKRYISQELGTPTNQVRSSGFGVAQARELVLSLTIFNPNWYKSTK